MSHQSSSSSQTSLLHHQHHQMQHQFHQKPSSFDSSASLAPEDTMLAATSSVAIQIPGGDGGDPCRSVGETVCHSPSAEHDSSRQQRHHLMFKNTEDVLPPTDGENALPVLSDSSHTQRSHWSQTVSSAQSVMIMASADPQVSDNSMLQSHHHHHQHHNSHHLLTSDHQVWRPSHHHHHQQQQQQQSSEYHQLLHDPAGQLMTLTCMDTRCFTASSTEQLTAAPTLVQSLPQQQYHFSSVAGLELPVHQQQQQQAPPPLSKLSAGRAVASPRSRLSSPGRRARSSLSVIVGRRRRLATGRSARAASVPARSEGAEGGDTGDDRSSARPLSPPACAAEPLRLESCVEEVERRFQAGCDCSTEQSCFRSFNAAMVFQHRLNIAELNRLEHDMYLMGVTMACMANPEETARHKERKRMRARYVFRGREVCLNAFLYLENCTHYQVKRIRKHVTTHGVTPRVHGNHGRLPVNTLSLHTYHHVRRFLSLLLERLEAGVYKRRGADGSLVAPAYLTRKAVYYGYTQYMQQRAPDQRPMSYSAFLQFLRTNYGRLRFSNSVAPSSSALTAASEPVNGEFLSLLSEVLAAVSEEGEDGGGSGPALRQCEAPSSDCLSTVTSSVDGAPVTTSAAAESDADLSQGGGSGSIMFSGRGYDVPLHQQAPPFAMAPFAVEKSAMVDSTAVSQDSVTNYVDSSFHFSVPI